MGAQAPIETGAAGQNTDVASTQPAPLSQGILSQERQVSRCPS